MNFRNYQKIHFQLDLFEFAQAKKLVALKGGVHLNYTREDMVPIISLHEKVIILKTKDVLPYQLIAFWYNRSLRLGFIDQIFEEDYVIKNLKNPSEVFQIKKYLLLGKIKTLVPQIFMRLRIKKILNSQSGQ